MAFASWMECTLGHMWPVGDGDHCPVCGRIGWGHSEKVEDDSAHMQRAMVIKNVAEMEAEIRHLRQVIAEQARHHKLCHEDCAGLTPAT